MSYTFGTGPPGLCTNVFYALLLGGKLLQKIAARQAYNASLRHSAARCKQELWGDT